MGRSKDRLESEGEDDGGEIRIHTDFDVRFGRCSEVKGGDYDLV